MTAIAVSWYQPTITATAVCANDRCTGGGWWRDQIPDRCPRCGGTLQVRDRVAVVGLR